MAMGTNRAHRHLLYKSYPLRGNARSFDHIAKIPPGDQCVDETKLGTCLTLPSMDSGEIESETKHRVSGT